MIIAVMWSGGIVADAALSDFTLSPYVYTTMLTLCGAVFGTSLWKGVR
jgi:hypothetical protein